MTTPTLPKLRLHHGSSAMAMSQDEPLPNLPTIMKFPPLKINAAAKTDLWRKPPHTDVDNAPTILLSTPIDLHKFHTAKVTVNGTWGSQYDQGGLVLFIPDEDVKKWVKTGIEFVDGKPVISTVGTSRWSDWSLVPLPANSSGKITVQVERETKNDERVESLWIYIIDHETGEKFGIRELTWWFRHDIGDKEKSTEEPRNLLIGIYAARPTVPEGEGKADEELVVNFEDFEVTLFDD